MSPIPGADGGSEGGMGVRNSRGAAAPAQPCRSRYAEDGEQLGGAVESRDGRASELRAWCEGSAVPWPAADVSDLAAVLIAAGRSGPVVRDAVLTRARIGVGIPAVGSYTRLRRDAERLQRWDAAIADAGGGAVGGALGAPSGGRARAWMYAGRAEPLRRRLQGMRSAVVGSLVVHQGGVRGVRRERKEGVHLTIEQRERLFMLLCWTPAPVEHYRWSVHGLGQAAVADVAGAVSGRVAAVRGGGSADAGAPGGRAAALGRPLERIEQWARSAEAAGTAPMRFSSAYDTATYLAGRYFDGIRGSATWNSQEFDAHRLRVDIHGELVAFSADAAELQTLGAELQSARNAVGGAPAREVDARMRALSSVWGQLVDRLVSLDRIADAMAHLDEDLRAKAGQERVSALDRRIDDLVGRSSGHEVVTGEMDRLGEDVEGIAVAGPGMLGYRTSVEREIEELTSRNR